MMLRLSIRVGRRQVCDPFVKDSYQLSTSYPFSPAQGDGDLRAKAHRPADDDAHGTLNEEDELGQNVNLPCSEEGGIYRPQNKP